MALQTRRPASGAETGAQAPRQLAHAGRAAWLGGLIARRVSLSAWQQVLRRRAGDVKVVVDLTK
jgi:hypothetical protein